MRRGSFILLAVRYPTSAQFEVKLTGYDRDLVVMPMAKSLAEISDTHENIPPVDELDCSEGQVRLFIIITLEFSKKMLKTKMNLIFLFFAKIKNKNSGGRCARTLIRTNVGTLTAKQAGSTCVWLRLDSTVATIANATTLMCATESIFGEQNGVCFFFLSTKFEFLKSFLFT